MPFIHGHLDDLDISCLSCGGHGSIATNRIAEYQTCSTCGGSGFIHIEESFNLVGVESFANYLEQYLDTHNIVPPVRLFNQEVKK